MHETLYSSQWARVIFELVIQSSLEVGLISNKLHRLLVMALGATLKFKPSLGGDEILFDHISYIHTVTSDHSQNLSIASPSSSDIATNSCLTSFSNLKQSLPLFCLSYTSNSYTILVIRFSLIPFTFPNLNKNFLPTPQSTSIWNIFWASLPRSSIYISRPLRKNSVDIKLPYHWTDVILQLPHIPRLRSMRLSPTLIFASSCGHLAPFTQLLKSLN